MRTTDTMLRARANDSLSLDEMRARLPAIFAAEPHESRSARYVFISTEEVLQNLVREGFDPVEARVSRSRDTSRQAHTKHMVRFRQRNEMASRKVGDTSFEVILRNGHDGTSAYDFYAGLFRLICLNGMVVDDGKFASAHVRHTGNHERQTAQIIDAAYTVIKEAPRVMEAPKLWSTIELNRDEQMAFAESAHVVRFGDAEGKVETPIQPAQLLIPRRVQDTGKDLWSTFNVLQENAVRGGLSAPVVRPDGRVRQSTTREVRSVDGDIKLNRALWQLGARMAELKVGA